MRAPGDLGRRGRWASADIRTGNRRAAKVIRPLGRKMPAGGPRALPLGWGPSQRGGDGRGRATQEPARRSRRRAFGTPSPTGPPVALHAALVVAGGGRGGGGGGGGGGGARPRARPPAPAPG